MQPDSEESKFVGELLKADCLLDKYRDTLFYNSILSIANGDTKIRCIRRDGNCFYYSFVFLMLEHYSTPALASELIRTLSLLNTTLKETGVDEYLINEFTDPIITVLKSFTTGESLEIEELDSIFWSYSVTYFRMLISAHIKRNRKDFEGFIEGDIENYCTSKIEATNQYAGEIEVTAIVKCLGVSFEVLCIENGRIDTIQWGEGPKIGSLLFISCHFDIIYIA